MYDRATLSFNVSTTSDYSYTIRYKDGLPIYVERYEALFYLQPTCINQILNNNLDWINNIETLGVENVTNKVSQQLNYTVEAGTFQCVNVTLGIRGMDSGSLSMIYDVDSGLLVYAQFTPGYGDIIVQFLASKDYVQGIHQDLMFSLISIILSGSALATPVAIVVQQGRKRLKNRHSPEQEMPADGLIKSGFSKKLLIVALVGGSLSLASVFLPWGSVATSITYLPFSLTPLLDQASLLLPANLTFILLNLAVYASAILAWASIALHIFTCKKNTSYVVALVSCVFGFASAAIYWQTGWTPSWGLYVILAGSILTLLSIAAANVHIKIEMEPEDSEKQEDSETRPETPTSAESEEPDGHDSS